MFREVAIIAGEELTPPRNLFQNLETATGYDNLYMLSYKDNLQDEATWLDAFIENLKDEEKDD